MSGSPGSSRHLWFRAGAYVMLVVAVSNLLVSGPVEGDLLALRHGLAAAAARVLSLLGTASTAQEDYIRLSGGGVRVDDSCTGLDASLFVAAAMLLFPTRWGARVVGVVAAFAILMPLNFLRVLSLAYWQGTGSDWFGPAHVYVWPAAVVTVSLATLLGWLTWISPREA
jgi:exosortase/archaeosortase family protein